MDKERDTMYDLIVQGVARAAILRRNAPAGPVLPPCLIEKNKMACRHNEGCVPSKTL
jgi:hypothetical protein